MNEFNLIKNLKVGDEEAVEYFLKEYKIFILRILCATYHKYISNRFANVEDKAEMLQMFYAKFFTYSIREYKKECSFRNFIKVCAINVAVDYLRGVVKKNMFQIDLQNDGIIDLILKDISHSNLKVDKDSIEKIINSDKDKMYLRMHFEDFIRYIIEHLTQKECILFKLRYLEQKDIETIKEGLNLSESNLYQRLHRMRVKLKDIKKEFYK